MSDVLMIMARLQTANRQMTEYFDMQEKLIVELTNAPAADVAKRRPEYQALQTLIDTTQTRIGFLTNALNGAAHDRLSKQAFGIPSHGDRRTEELTGPSKTEEDPAG